MPLWIYNPVNYLVLFFSFILIPGATGQSSHDRSMPYAGTPEMRVQDSLLAASVPDLPVDESMLLRSLPVAVDNSTNQFWPGIHDQHLFYSCQQHAGVTYTFGYEINCARNTTGWFWENQYPAHYTWNFMNQGERYVGVNFLQSFEAIRQQGHMTNAVYGDDTLQTYLGWVSGYDKYYQGMKNRLKQVYAIRINSEEGVNTLRNYLFDHLDGSAAGGIACFTTDSWSLQSMAKIPAGSPEEGKNIILFWFENPVHGLTIVGYNDSIRFDRNGDGAYTNSIDITGDGIVDIRDWEKGAFKLANSYGGWWADNGYAYVLYSAMASHYEEGGVWNNRVYVVEPDTAYEPLLTAKVTMKHDCRNSIRLLAGISTDTLAGIPGQIMTFPVFNFQGGNHQLPGNDSSHAEKRLEFGLDLTALVDKVANDTPFRLFFGVEERDPQQKGSGTIENVTFIRYSGIPHEFQVADTSVPVGDNEITWVSAIADLTVDRVTVKTTVLPAMVTGVTYQAQLEAEGGDPPYSWEMVKNYSKLVHQSTFPQGIDSALSTISHLRPFTALPLPFAFPFYGTLYDTVYVNRYGFVSFEPQALPAPYITDEITFLRYFPVISPAFSQQYAFYTSSGDGVFCSIEPERVSIRWKASSAPQYGRAGKSNFALIINADGSFECVYDEMDIPVGIPVAYRGVSEGNATVYDLEMITGNQPLAGTSLHFQPAGWPQDIEITPEGLLICDEVVPDKIFRIAVRVSDQQHLSDTRIFDLSTGPVFDHQVVSASGNRFTFGSDTRLKLTLTNAGSQPLSNMTLLLSAPGQNVTFSDSLVALELLSPGQTLTLNEVFHFNMKTPLPSGYPVNFRLRATSNGTSWVRDFVIPVSASDLSFDMPVIDDGDNHIIDPGETADLVVPVTNRGDLAAPGVRIIIESGDTLITMEGASEKAIGDINPLNRHEALFRLKCSRSAPLGHSFPMSVYALEGDSVLSERHFTLSAGKRLVALAGLTSTGNSLMAMTASLDSLGITYDSFADLDFEPEQYQSVFVILGSSSGGTHTLTLDEASRLAGYLQRQGRLYLEGYYTWHYTNQTLLHPMFMIASEQSPVGFFRQPAGVPSTFTESMDFNYVNSLNYAIFRLSPMGTAKTTLVQQDDTTQALEVAYDGPGYKTIGTILEFGSMNGSTPASSRTNLMKQYLEFFGLNISGPHALFHSDTSTLCAGGIMRFTDDSYDSIQAWHWEFPGGNPETSTLSSPQIQYDTPGTYDVTLTVSNGSDTNSITRHDYVRVKICQGLHPVATKSLFTIFPNPSNGTCYLRSGQMENGWVTIHVSDITGRTVASLRKFIQAGVSDIKLDFTDLRPGIYFIRMHGNQHGPAQKLILNK